MIPVKDLAKYDKVPLEEEEVELNEEETEFESTPEVEKGRGIQMTLVYVIFLAEAYVPDEIEAYRANP